MATLKEPAPAVEPKQNTADGNVTVISLADYNEEFARTPQTVQDVPAKPTP